MELIKTIKIIKESVSKNDILLKYFGYSNQRVYKELNKLINENNIDISHLIRDNRYCTNCNKPILNRGNIFCSRSCAAIFNNKKRSLSKNTKFSG